MLFFTPQIQKVNLDNASPKEYSTRKPPSSSENDKNNLIYFQIPDNSILFKNKFLALIY